jgi:hypothetical protein
MRQMLWRLWILVIVALPGTAAAEGPRVEIFEYGRYAAGEFVHTPDPSQLGGQRWSAPVRNVERTDTIPGHLGRIFGFRVRIHDTALRGQTLTFRIRHPKLTAPSGRTATEHLHTAVAPAPGGTLGHFFAFEYTYEIAEGDWTFEVLHEGRVLAAQKFRVVVSMF